MTTLAPFADHSTITDAQIEAIDYGYSPELVRVLVGSGASVQLTLDAFCEYVPDFDGLLAVQAANLRKAVQELLQMHPVSPWQALCVGINAVLPAVVRANLEAGMVQWRAGRRSGWASISEFLGEPYGFLTLDFPAVAAVTNPDELEVARILVSHPSFTMGETMVVSGIVHSEDWFRELPAIFCSLPPYLSSLTWPFGPRVPSVRLTSHRAVLRRAPLSCTTIRCLFYMTMGAIP